MTSPGGTPAPTSPPRPGVLSQIRSFGRPFWAANVMELVERLAYYGVRVVIPIYIASSEDPGGLHFSNTEKAQILMPWAVVQTLLPMFTGGFADRYGRKLTIAVSIAIKIVGYLLMATQRSFWGFLLGCLVLATGTAIFKPGVQGTLVRGTTPENASVGWGIFYEVVNVGGALGPPLAGFLHGFAWKYVFFACAAIVSVNFLVLLGYEDDPAEGTDGAAKVLVTSVAKMFRPRLLVFIAIMSGFWLMFMQLYDTLPNFIEEWTDSGNVVRVLGLREGMLAAATPRGLQVPQEWMINLDAALIVLFMIPIAALTARATRLRAMVAGIFVASAGLALSGLTMNGALCLAGIFVFAIGEMIASPKMLEYLGVIAPRGEEALYMGFGNVPVAVGWTVGTFGAGVLYDRTSDKANLALRYLREHGLAAPDRLATLKRTEAMTALTDALGMDASAATRVLWDAYAPWTIWFVFVGIGLASACAMIAFARHARRWTKESG
ncbi:MAG: MFS transporter [Polyangiaceae bacterium]